MTYSPKRSRRPKKIHKNRKNSSKTLTKSKQILNESKRTAKVG